MKTTIALLAILTANILCVPAKADETPSQRSNAQNRAEIIKKFDADADGKLSAEEAAKARRAIDATKSPEAERPVQNREYQQAFSIKNPKDFKLDGGKEIFSGPQAGEPLPKLEVTVTGGEQDGQVINALGTSKGVQILVFADQSGSTARGVIGLLRLANTINAGSKTKLHAIVVYLGDDTNALAANIKRYRNYIVGSPTIGLSRDGRDGPGSYGLDRNISMTVLVAENGVVKYNFPFPQGMLTPDPHLLGAITEVLAVKTESMEKWLSASYGNRGRANAKTRANPSGIDVRSLIAPVLDKSADAQAIEAAAKRIDLILEKNKAAAAQIGAMAKRIIDSGKLADYGTERSQYHLFKWAKLYGVVKSEVSPPQDK